MKNMMVNVEAIRFSDPLRGIAQYLNEQDCPPGFSNFLMRVANRMDGNNCVDFSTQSEQIRVNVEFCLARNILYWVENTNQYKVSAEIICRPQIPHANQVVKISESDLILILKVLDDVAKNKRADGCLIYKFYHEVKEQGDFVEVSVFVDGACVELVQYDDNPYSDTYLRYSNLFIGTASTFQEFLELLDRAITNPC